MAVTGKREAVRRAILLTESWRYEDDAALRLHLDEGVLDASVRRHARYIRKREL